MNAQQKIDTKDLAETISGFFSKFAHFTNVSQDQSGLKPNQIRLYQDNDCIDRQYFIVTVTPEKI